MGAAAENFPVDTARCPACHAAVAPNAAWCTLCFTDLRPATVAGPTAVPASGPTPEPVVEAAAELAAAPVAQLTAEPLVLPLDDLPLDEVPAIPDLPIAATAATAVEPTTSPTVDRLSAEPTWPCPLCGEAVSIELDACPQCGAAFLSEPQPTMRLSLPVVGDLSTASDGVRAIVGCVAAVGLSLVFLLLFAIGGKLF